MTEPTLAELRDWLTEIRDWWPLCPPGSNRPDTERYCDALLALAGKPDGKNVLDEFGTLKDAVHPPQEGPGQ